MSEKPSKAVAVSYAVEDAGSDSEDVAATPVRVQPAQAVDTDFLSEIIDGDDGYVGPSSPSGPTVIRKTLNSDSDERMRTFLKQKDSVLADLDTINSKAQVVREITQQLENVFAEDEAKKLQKELNDHIKAGDSRCTKVKKKLNQLKKSTKTMKKAGDASLRSQIGIRENLQQTLDRRFIEVMRDLQDAKSSFKNRLRENITRQVKIADPEATEDEISEAIESGTVHDLLQKSLNRCAC